MPKVWNKRDPNTPKDAVYVGRPTEWGNPYHIGLHGSRKQTVEKYRKYILDAIMTSDRCAAGIERLRGKDLVCWCAPKLCHANVLLEIANR